MGLPVAVRPVVVGQVDLLQDCRSALAMVLAVLVVRPPCYTFAVAAAAVAVGLAVPCPTYGQLLLLACRPYSAGRDNVRTGRGGPSSCWDRGSHGIGAASDARDTHSDHPSAACHRLPCAVEEDLVDHRAYPAAVAGDAEALLHAVAYHSHRHCGQASSTDAVDAVVAR